MIYDCGYRYFRNVDINFRRQFSYNGDHWEKALSRMFNGLKVGTWKIKELLAERPNVDKDKECQIWLLKELELKGYKWIARDNVDEDCNYPICAFKGKPKDYDEGNFVDVANEAYETIPSWLLSITYEKSPYKITDLIKELEG